MPLPDDDDVRRRFRASAPPLHPHANPGVINDFRAAQSRHFPGVGKTLPPRDRFATQPSASFGVARQPLRPLQRLATSTSRSEARNTPLQPRQVAPLPLPVRSVPPLQPRASAATQTATISASLPTPKHLGKERRKRKRFFTKGRIFLATLLVLLAGGGWLGFKFLYTVQSVFHGNIFSVLTVTKLKGEDTGRVNILLAGNSADDPGHNGANLTDSIMVISIDVKNHTAFLLSVPRDLWVAIPGYGHAKINEAYVDGQAGSFNDSGYPPGGMGLLAEVVQQNLDIKTNYYALIDYNALKEGVDAVGGIDVNIQSSDSRGLYDPSTDWSTHGPLVKLKNGSQHLSGVQALDLARARGDANGSYGFPRSDFDRTEHQRLMMLALKGKVLSLGTFANPLTISNLFDSIGKNVRTDFTLSEVRRLYDIGKSVNNNQIQSVGLNDAGGVNLLSSYTSPNQQSALIPAAGLDDFSKIQVYVTRLMTNNQVALENARAVVLNGTSTVGLAAKKQTDLENKAVNVVAVGDAQAQVATTIIIDNSKGNKPATLKLLKTIYGANTTTVNPYANNYTADFIIVLGNDQAPVAGPSQ